MQWAQAGLGEERLAARGSRDGVLHEPVVFCIESTLWELSSSLSSRMPIAPCIFPPAFRHGLSTEHTFTFLQAQKDLKCFSRPFVATAVFWFPAKLEHPPYHVQKDGEIDVTTQERQEHTG